MGWNKYKYVALDQHVLLVAVSNEYDWTAYIGAVPGRRHEDEFMEVASHGSKVSKELAELFFQFDVPWRN